MTASEAGGWSAIELRDVRCIPEATIPLHPHATVILGGNGAGKSTLVEALASLAFGEGEGLREFPLRRGSSEGEIALLDASGERVARWSSAGERLRLPALPMLLAYGRFRRLKVVQPTHNELAGFEILSAGWTDEYTRAPVSQRLAEAMRGRRTTTMFRADEGLLSDLDAFVVHLHDERAVDPRAEAACQRLDLAVRALGEDLDAVTPLRAGDRRVAGISRRNALWSLAELSDGFQSLLSIVIDLVLREAYVGGSREGNSLGLVVIDEVDLHLHPRWQRRVVEQLTSVFPHTQFVLTTHSLAVVQSAIDKDFGVVTLHDEGAGTRAVPLGERERKALHHAELCSIGVDGHLFGVDSRLSPTGEAKESEASALRAKVSDGTATAADRKRLLSALDKLQVWRVAEERRRGDGPLFAEITETQLALLKQLSASLGEPKSHGASESKGRRGARGMVKEGRKRVRRSR